MHHSTSRAILCCALAFVACTSVSGPGEVGRRSPAPPLSAGVSALEASLALELPAAAGEEHPELHNLFVLSPNVISGGEPGSPAALELLAQRGVKTIISVDGKVPDASTAAELGLRYVHIPIQYKVITPDELLRLAKTFRELEAPFFVHCFHGPHRGPAAAAVGRLVLDGISRTQALAEMRQWMGTSTKYAGLYRTVASAPLPTAAEPAASSFAFPAAHPFEGFRAMMVETSRVWDRLVLLSKGGWRADPAHPDIVPLNEARQLAELYGAALELDDVRVRPASLRDILAESHSDAAALVRALEDASAAPSAVSQLEVTAGDSMDRLKAACGACHQAHRNS